MQAFTALAANAAENLSPGQVAGSGTNGTSGSGTGTTSPSGSSGSGTVDSGATGTSTSPAQSTANAAPVIGSQSFLGLGVAAVAALALW